MKNVTPEIEATIIDLLKHSLIVPSRDGHRLQNVWQQCLNAKTTICTSCPSTLAHYKEQLRQHWNNHLQARAKAEAEAARLEEEAEEITQQLEAMRDKNLTLPEQIQELFDAPIKPQVVDAGKKLQSFKKGRRK